MSTLPVRAAMVPITPAGARVFCAGEPGDRNANDFRSGEVWGVSSGCAAGAVARSGVDRWTFNDSA